MKTRKILKKTISFILALSMILSVSLVMASAKQTNVINYHVGNEIHTYSYTDDQHSIGYSDDTFGDEYCMKIVGEEAIVGWRVKETGKEIYYTDFTSCIIKDNPGELNLYPIGVKLALLPEDVYYFNHDSRYFLLDGNNYYMTEEHEKLLLETTLAAGKNSSLQIPAYILSKILKAYPDFSWNGSCIGYTTTACLQKKGLLDVVSTQEGATCIRDLEPTPDLISLMNYYNGHATINVLPKNKAIGPGSKEYARQLKNLYECVEAGNLTLMEFIMIIGYHGFACTGAFTDATGAHYLIIYDENNELYVDGKFIPAYANGYVDIVKIAPDFSTIETNYGELPAIFWSADFESYKAFDINGNYDSSIYLNEVRRQTVHGLTSFLKAHLPNILKAFA